MKTKQGIHLLLLCVLVGSGVTVSFRGAGEGGAFVSAR